MMSRRCDLDTFYHRALADGLDLHMAQVKRGFLPGDLVAAVDFPKDAPILVITDGECDYLVCRRAHAFLLPVGGRLPFDTRAPIFHFDRSE
jgi:hypothetical protein